MDFYNSSEIVDKAVSIGFHHGVLEHDGVRGYMCVAAFDIPSDAKTFAEYLAELGRDVEVVDLDRMSQEEA